jgi:hypothetical protein
LGSFLQSGITAVAGLGGICAGALLTARNQKVERRNARIREQLQDFYSPLLGMKFDIRAKSDIRQKLHGIANREWEKVLSGISDPLGKKKIEEANWPRYQKLLDHSEAQLRNELVPFRKCSIITPLICGSRRNQRCNITMRLLSSLRFGIVIWTNRYHMK